MIRLHSMGTKKFAREPDKLLLLGIHADRRLTSLQRCRDGGVDMAKLGVAIGMRRTLGHLAVGLQAVAQ